MIEETDMESPRADKNFALRVFTKEERKVRLSKKVFQKLEETIANRQKLAPDIADEIANAMKEWAMDNGANFYTHWFQPLTGATAEKHDSFLDLSLDGKLSMEFSGKQLVQGEPDASSLPSGGIRSTFEARGYTIWDPISPVFIKKTGDVSTLCIPSVFLSYTGEALDLKTPLLRSHESLQKSTKKLLTFLGQSCKDVKATIGVEQEYFLIDRSTYFARPDLVACGRTLIGNPPAKGQELDDHYFGSIKPQILQFMQEAEKEMYQVGIPITTRHNEVAPSQFETAPIFQDLICSVDQNLLVMEIMDEVAERYGLKLLLHEKPFANVNGNGKHCNWSVSVDGKNLLEPGKDPSENLTFLLMLSIIIRAVDRHAEALRISVSSAGNDHRLGANEAPPAIISIFLGTDLTNILEQVAHGKKSNLESEKNMDLFVQTLPDFPKHSTDRNRTSPFAFTGNKFEFRAGGSAQNISAPNFTINAIVAESMDYVTSQLEAKTADGQNIKQAMQQVIKKIWLEHSRVVFNGDNYSDNWVKEAKKRGLPNLTNAVDAFEVYSQKKIVDLFEKYNVLSKAEIISRQKIRSELYSNLTEIEARAMLDLINSMVLPSSYEQQEQLSNAYYSCQKAGISATTMQQQKRELEKLTETINALITEKEKLNELLKGVNKIKEELKKAKYNQSKIIPCMLKVRSFADILEVMVDDDLWKLPKYREILFNEAL
jgi:glutamine synthetase